MDYLNIRIRKREIIYDGKVKKTYNGQGIVRVKDTYLGKRAYIIFPLYRQDDGEDVIVAVDEIRNRGIHPNTNSTCRALLAKEYVGRKCIVVLQEGQ